MEINERIQEVRKALGLSRRAFGEKLGVSESVIVNIEYDRLKRPDQKEPIYRLICEKFDVNDNWLRSGIENMFIELDRDEEITAWSSKITRSDFDNKFVPEFVHMLSKLDSKDWETLEKIAIMLSKKKD